MLNCSNKSIVFGKKTAIAFSALLASCTEFTNVGPPHTQLTQQAVFVSDQAAVSALTGMYSRMVAGGGFASGGGQSITVLAGLSSDELITYSSGENLQFESNQLVAENSRIRQALWSEPYRIIYTCNAILEALTVSNQVSEGTKAQLAGEAKFVRAFCYFYLINLFGDVPLHLTTNYRTNSTGPRTKVAEVYQQVIQDLLEAEKLLKEAAVVNRMRPDSWTVAALLARVYLYLKDWEKAAFWSSEIINSGRYVVESDIENTFLMTSKATIWQLMPVEPGRNTNEANYFVHTVSPASKATGEVLSNGLLNAFETGDLRKNAWVGAVSDQSGTLFYPFKYRISQAGHPLQECSIVFRLEEQLLIRAEARAQLGQLSESIDDINAVRKRAGLSDVLSDTGATTRLLVQQIFQERRIEFFAEWGQRWFDLKRSNQVDSVMISINSFWKPTSSLYPIPASEVQSNPSIDQNAGY